MVWFVLGHSGQRTSVKCAETLWNYKLFKVRGHIVHLKVLSVIVISKSHSFPNPEFFCIFRENSTVITYLQHLS